MTNLTIETLCLAVSGLDQHRVEGWIAQGWVRPAGQAGAWHFRAIDVARVRLIQDLCTELRVEEDTLPVVLSLLDQLYDARRQLRRLRSAVEDTVPPELGQTVVAALRTGS